MTVKKNVGQNKRRVGRPTTVDAEEKITVRLPSAVLSQVDDWAAQTGVKRSEAVREMIGYAIAGRMIDNARKSRRQK
jgi:metal-responsive CopG/Arc/MetJ family transcriptional regulator